MKPLDPDSRRLIEQVNAADVPPAALEAQLWQRLAPRLGDALPPTAAAALPAAKGLAAKSSLLGTGPLLKLTLAGLLVGASVSGAVYYRSASITQATSQKQLAIELREPAASPPDTAVSRKAAADPRRSEAPTAAPSPSVAVLEAELGSPAPGESSSVAVSAPTQAAADSGSLVQETRLLARAQRALRSGKPASALQLIEQHASTYPQGSLAQERDAARVLALCALERLPEARRSQQQFLRAWPGSPLTERVQRACR